MVSFGTVALIDGSSGHASNLEINFILFHGRMNNLHSTELITHTRCQEFTTYRFRWLIEKHQDQ